MAQKGQVRAGAWGYKNHHAQLVGMHTGVAQATCYSLIRARVADPKTGSSVRNSYQASYNNIYENNHCDVICGFMKLKATGCPSLGKETSKSR